jgi:serine/threonine-protein phosphatase 2A activator
MLDDISGVKTWSKINSGMIKMYTAEVLCKLPVAQHFLFGTLLAYPEPLVSEEGERGEEEETKKIHEDSSGHLHVKGEGFGDCCGIPIPSRFAAMEEERKKMFAASGGVRRIPFD